MSDPIFLSSLNIRLLNGGGTVLSGFLGSTPICLKLPDPVGNETRATPRITGVSVGLAATARAISPMDRHPQRLPHQRGADVSTGLVSSNRTLRIGLSTFNPVPPATTPAMVVTLPVPSVIAGVGGCSNYNALIASINGLSAVANTPLAETYYEVTRYMRGMAPYYNSTPSTYTSPIQYRCQKNYGVVITDGLPTYDRTFPTNDPLGGSRLPNWDGNNNDGDNLSGDREGDTCIWTTSPSSPSTSTCARPAPMLAGKSWNAVDFPKQNMNTYTVGFTAANQMLSDAAGYGQGKYYQATDSTGLNAALSSALSDITSEGRLRWQRRHQRHDPRQWHQLFPDQLRPQGLARHNQVLRIHRQWRGQYHVDGNVDH
jgi:type IV pilus assembly protein PilY1